MPRAANCAGHGGFRLLQAQAQLPGLALNAAKIEMREMREDSERVPHHELNEDEAQLAPDRGDEPDHVGFREQSTEEAPHREG